MKELEKKIEEASFNHAHGYSNEGAYTVASKAFKIGAKSPEDKAFWQEGMFDRKQLQEAIDAGINEGLRKAQQGMYTEEEVIDLISRSSYFAAQNALNYNRPFESRKWFEQNKKT